MTIPLFCCFVPALASATALEIRNGMPDHHLVVKGDTLWAISAQAYHDPLKWRYLWAINRGLVKNPHWIYPRQNLLLYPSFPVRLKLEARLESLRGAIHLAVPAAPAPAELEISMHILSIFGGVAQEGQQAMVILDKGQRDGIRNGLVLALYRNKNPEGRLDKKPSISGDSYGSLQVYHTLDKSSYAVVTKAAKPVTLLDVASFRTVASAASAAPPAQAATAAVSAAPPVQVTAPATSDASAISLVQAAALETPVSTVPSNQRKGGDARKCLELGSDREIAACAEKFR
jgi:hypothetical protein